MSTGKPRKKAKASGASHGSGSVGGRAEAGGGVSKGGASSAPPSKALIAQENWKECEADIQEAMKLHEGEVLKCFPNSGSPRFILKKLRDGTEKAELGDSLSRRTFELAWKIKPEFHDLVTALIYLTALPRGRLGHDVGQLLISHAAFLTTQTEALPPSVLTGIMHPEFLCTAGITLSMLEMHLGDDLKRLLKHPPGTLRKKAAQALKKKLSAAVDALNQQSLREPHGSLVAYETPVAHGQIAKMPLALSAIIEARIIVERKRREPCKAELRECLKQKHDGLLPKQDADSFWTPVWKKAGLNGLKKTSTW